MVFLLLVAYFFRGLLTILILVGGIGVRGGIWVVSVCGEELKWHQLAHHQQPANNLILFHIVQLKPMIKAQISGRMVL